MAGNQEIFTYFNTQLTLPIRDSLWKHIYFPKDFQGILNAEPFLKLNYIRQLGPAYLVYPGATHTRANHSMGVYYLAVQIIKALISQPDCPPLTLSHVKAFLAAALLHDTGHFPYTHSLKELPLKDHEVLTSEIIESLPISGKLEEAGINPQEAALIVDLSRPLPKESPLWFYRNILSGVLDPDKLDYLNRDAFYCGVPYGIQDTDFIFQEIRFHPHNGISLSSKGLMAIENVLFSKYQMYKSVYWHPQVRLYTALVKKGIFLAMTNGWISPTDLYFTDDREFYSLTSTLPEKAALLLRAAQEPGRYQLMEEVPYETHNDLHRQLQDLEFRRDYENQLMKKLESTYKIHLEYPILMDIPEDINFEVSFPILGQGGFQPFLEANTAFSKQNVQFFTQSLRKIRIFMATEDRLKIKHYKSFLAPNSKDN